MSDSDCEDRRARWEARFREGGGPGARPAEVLAQNRHLLPARGSALDLACGRGGNALLLAAGGLQTWAWDWSAAAVEAVREAARGRGLALSAEVRDVVAEPPEPGRFDVVVVSRFLERGLFPAIAAALRPGGLLFYQTFIRERVDGGGPSNPDFRLGDNELLRAFGALHVIAYREEGRLGDLSVGLRNEALLIAQRRADDGPQSP
ncbi:MAG: class I SAM-dependent methyltransferase [Gammaproteobacteria bacterium]